MDSIDSMGGGGEMGAETPTPATPDASQNTVILSADHFPNGMSPKAGEKLTFVVTADADSEGNVAGHFEPTGGAENDEDSWEKDFKASMNPAKPQEEPA